MSCFVFSRAKRAFNWFPDRKRAQSRIRRGPRVDSRYTEGGGAVRSGGARNRGWALTS